MDLNKHCGHSINNKLLIEKIVDECEIFDIFFIKIYMSSLDF